MKRMKRFHISHIPAVFFLLAALSLPAQNKDLYKGRLQVESAGLKQEGDSLLLSFSVHIQGQAVTGSQSMLLIPELRAGNNTDSKTLTLPYILIDGDERQKLNERSFALAGADKRSAYHRPQMHVNTRQSTDTTLLYKLKIPYESWLGSARFVLYQQVTGYRQESRLYALSLSDKVEMEAYVPYQASPAVSFLVPDRETKARQLRGKAFLDFQADSSHIDPGFSRNAPKLARISQAVSDVKNNPDAVITGLFIEGYASPDGLYATNERLSKERSLALRDYLKTKFGFDGGLFKVSHVAEDWDGLVVQVQASGMEYRDKVLEIIATTGITAGREVALMRLANGAPYRQMLREIFPELRRVEYRVDYTVRDYTLEESKSLFSRKPEDLSQLELYNLARSYGKGTKEYTDILLEAIPGYYPGDVTANVNAAALLIENGEPNSAGRLLDRIAGTAPGGNHPAVLNNLGVIRLLAGELDEAEALFNRAKTAGSEEAARNLEEVAVKRADNQKMERYKNR
ncbi:DUF3868 domain-containing protein [Dysgonomonas termitidis]|uniref:DUF3868 domain-containing protein n=1 Tax=Dysgonomonas termitidis TaxID=1516126 RepID=A0ABV9L1T0_9BACT